MNTKYITQKLWDLFSHEILIWLFFISSFFKYLIKPMIYFWTVFGAWAAFILMDSPNKTAKLKKKKKTVLEVWLLQEQNDSLLLYA